MGCEVYANGDEIACKAGDGKVIAAFPDVCLSPPSPPAGPIPVPYPDTSFSKDMQNGSKTVKIKGKEVMLKDQSFYKTAPLGDEAATNGLGASVITHVITGKTYFAAWSMDVRFEGANVDRHLDLTTSNHGSYPGGTPPFPNISKMEQLALDRIAAGQCPCCGKPGGKCPGALSETFPNGAKREALSHREYFRLDEIDKNTGTLSDTAQVRRKAIADHPCSGGPGGRCPNVGKPERKSDAPCDVYRVLILEEAEEADMKKWWTSRNKAEHRDHHTVPKAKGAINAFFSRTPTGTIMDKTKPEWEAMDVDAQNKVVQIDHITERSAGGCPSSTNNTQSHGKKCGNCRRMDAIQADWHTVEQKIRRQELGLPISR